LDSYDINFLTQLLEGKVEEEELNGFLSQYSNKLRIANALYNLDHEMECTDNSILIRFCIELIKIKLFQNSWMRIVSVFGNLRSVKMIMFILRV